MYMDFYSNYIFNLLHFPRHLLNITILKYLPPEFPIFIIIYWLLMIIGLIRTTLVPFLYLVLGILMDNIVLQSKLRLNLD